MVNKTLHEYPDKKWYIFVEPDTWVFWQTMLVYLSRLDWTKPYYLGGQILIGDVEFGQGGEDWRKNAGTVACYPGSLFIIHSTIYGSNRCCQVTASLSLK